MEKVLSPEESEFLRTLLRKRLQKVSPELRYTEDGYDSCQANREVSKIVSQLICIGGVYRETHDYLGIELTPGEIEALFNLDFGLAQEELQMLGQVAIRVAAEQDFLFPGVTKSNEEVPDLETFTLETLLGIPRVSVRHLTGVGGLRFDRDWNYCLSFANFTREKVKEDKRFYPGLGIAYSLLEESDILRFPTIVRLLKKKPTFFVQLERLLKQLKAKDWTLYNVSLIQSAYTPPPSELAEARQWTMEGLQPLETRLGAAFHTPSYQYNYWKRMGQILAQGANYEQLSDVLGEMEKVDELFTFNSPIHLPWCAKLDYLAHHYIGRVRNSRGEYAIRYGVGLAKTGSSLEIRFYTTRNRIGLWETAAKLITYSDISFTKEQDSRWITSEDRVVKEVMRSGFLAFAVRQLAGK